MPLPLPVPSKAAIHALRGLALGTSCAIGVIVEDRRRRISTLKTAIANKKKLKASRHYHKAPASGPLPLEDDDAVLLDGTDLELPQRPETANDRDGHYSVSPSPWKRANKTTVSKHTEDVPSSEQPESPAQQAQQVPVSSVQEDLLAAAPNIPSNARFPVRSSASWGPRSVNLSNLPRKAIDPVSVARSISEILSSNDEERLNRALARFFTSPDTRRMLENAGDAWLEISARLSKECQIQRRWEDAAGVLNLVLESGPIEESQYYAHDPMSIVESYLPPENSNIRSSLDAFAKASRLFLATFTDKPQTNCLQVERIGKRLITEALDLQQFRSAQAIFWRVLVQLDDGSDFTAWAIEMLFQHHDYKNVVKYFLLNFSKMNPDSLLFDKTVDYVVYSVEAMQGLKAAQVFRAYAQMVAASDRSLRTNWIMRLLQAHWRRYRNFSLSKELFDEARTLGLLDRVGHPQGVYRVMVELATRADELTIANSYHDELLYLYPEMASDIPLKGYFAVVKAKAGDWDAVYEDFVEMHPNRHRQPEEYSAAFVMVLKVFAEDHPVAEVRDFVTRYTCDLDVGMHRYAVTLVANKYGQCRDMAGFLAWLEYCSDAGFTLDPAFCNAVLHNCHTRWKLNFNQLKSLVSAMRQLNPSATDDTTERILSQASRTGSTKTYLPPKTKQARHKAVSVSKLAYVGRSTNNRDVYEAMNQEIGIGKHTAAIAIYRRAMRFGMPFCSHCFRLAVTAALEVPGNNGPGSAFHLIHNAHEQGQDVSSAVSAFIRVQMDRFRAGTSDLIQHMQNLITRFEALHIIIDGAVLTHTALICIKLGQHAKAISLCYLAMERGGDADNPCFSRQCFRALLKAYSQTLDVGAMEDLLAALLHRSDFGSEKKTLALLKSTLKQVQTYHWDQATVAMEEVLRRAVRDVKKLRAVTRKEGRVITQETLRIMGEALGDFQGRAAAGYAREEGEEGGDLWEY